MYICINMLFQADLVYVGFGLILENKPNNHHQSLNLSGNVSLESIMLPFKSINVRLYAERNMAQLFKEIISHRTIEKVSSVMNTLLIADYFNIPY